MGEACNTLGRDFSSTGFYFETLKERDHVEQLDV